MGRRKEIERHLTEEELDEAIDTAQSNEKAHLVRRLNFVKNLYRGDTANEAGRRVGVSSATASRWARAWNDGGVEGLRPSFGGGRPAKLSDGQRDRLVRVLKQHQPLTTEDVQRLIEDAFNVSYTRRHVRRLLRELGMNYSVPRPEEPDRPDDADELLEQRLDDALEDLRDDDLATDGGILVGFLDEAWPQPTDNRHRLWAFGTPTLRKVTPTENFDDAVFGFYAMNGNSVVACKPDVSKESVGEFFRADSSSEP
jgi:transposase